MNNLEYLKETGIFDDLITVGDYYNTLNEMCANTLTESFISKKTNKYDDEAKSYGLDPGELRTKITAHTSKLVSSLKSINIHDDAGIVSQLKKFNSEMKNAFIHGVNSAVEYVNDAINSSIKGIGLDAEGNAGKITHSIVLFTLVFSINTLLMVLLSTILPPTMVAVVFPVVIAPIVEEIAKLISITNNSDGTYNVVFNILEFTNYVFRPIKGLKLSVEAGLVTGKQALKFLGKFALVRQSAILMHTLNTCIIKFSTKFIKDTDKEKQTRVFATVFTFIIHALHNAFMVRINNSILIWMSK